MAQEFQSADELMAHYKALKSRVFGKMDRSVSRFDHWRIDPPKKVVVKVDKKPSPPPLPLHETPIELPGDIERRKYMAIINEECEIAGISVENLLSYDARQKYSPVRNKVMYRLRMELNYSLTKVGRIVHRDHSSVSHGIRKHMERIGQYDESYYGRQGN